MPPVLNLRSVLLSGEIRAIYDPNTDKMGKPKISFTIGIKTSNPKAQHTANITCYDMSVCKMPWFIVGKFVFIEAYLVLSGFYILENIHYNAYDCYKPLIDKIMRSIDGEELIE